MEKTQTHLSDLIADDPFREVPLARPRQVYEPKPPTYTPREMEAIKNADRVIVRILREGKGWVEEEFFPKEGQSLAQRLGEVQKAIKIMETRIAGSARMIIYIGGVVRGERMIAAVKRS